MSSRVICALLSAAGLFCTTSDLPVVQPHKSRVELICPHLNEVAFRLGSTIGPNSAPHIDTNVGLIWPLGHLQPSGGLLESIAIIEKVIYSEPGWSASPPPSEVLPDDPGVSRHPALELKLTPDGIAAFREAWRRSPQKIAPAIGLEFHGEVIRWAVLVASPRPLMVLDLQHTSLEAAATEIREQLACIGEAAA